MLDCIVAQYEFVIVFVQGAEGVERDHARSALAQGDYERRCGDHH
jgi:hypothetical protein